MRAGRLSRFACWCVGGTLALCLLLAQQPGLASRGDAPRIMVLVQENLQEVPASQTTENEIIRGLQAAGYLLVDPDQARKLVEQIRAEVLLAADIPPEALKKIGEDLNCDLLIVGTAVADHYATSGVVKAYVAALDLRVVSTSTAQVLRTVSHRAKGRGYEPGPAIRTALQRVAQESTRNLLASGALEIQPRINLFVMNVSDAQVHQLARSVASDMGTRVQVVYTSPELSLLDVMPGKDVTPSRVRATVKAFRSPPMEIVQTVGSKIVAQGKGTRVRPVATLGRPEGPLYPDPSTFIAQERGFTTGSLMADPVRLPNIYPARLLNYSSAFAVITLKNLDPGRPLHDVRVRVAVPEYMSVPAETRIEALRPGEEVEVVLQAIFDRDKLYENPQTKRASAELTLEYRDGPPGVNTYEIEVFNRNAMNWKDPRSILNFVTATDPVVKDFTSAVLSRVDLDGVQPSMVHILKANAIFAALASLPLRYVADPNPDYLNRTLDYVQFPRETLWRKSGDCDDLSVLFAACLESVGIATRFIVTRDHVFLEFDTGVSDKAWMDVSFNEERFTRMKDEVWIPLEVTRFCAESRCFTDAWLEGANRYRAVKGRPGTERVEFASDSEFYPSFPLPETRERVALLAKDLPVRIAESMSHLYREKDLALKKEQDACRERLARNAADLEAGNRLGILLSKGGQLQEARQVFASVLEKDRTHEKARHNLGNAYLLMNQPSKAVEQYRLVPRNESDPETLYNMGVAYFLLRDKAKAEASLRQAYDQLPESDPREKRVAWMLGVSDLRQDRQTRSSPWMEEFRQLIFQATGGGDPRPSSSLRGRQPARDRADEMPAPEILWWKM